MTYFDSSKSKWLMSDTARRRAELIESLKAGVMIGVVAVCIAAAAYCGA